MNNRIVTWVLALLWMAGAYYFFIARPQNTSAVPTQSPQAMLGQAQKKEEAAGTNAGKLRAVIKNYEAVANKAKRSETAAQARLHIGIIQETKLLKDGKPDGKTRQAALATYTKLARDFSPEESPAAREAQTRRGRLEDEIDRENSRHPLYKVMDTLVALTSRKPAYSYALALIIITAIFKILTTPLSHLQFRYMKEMQKLQPLVKQLQEKYKGNQKEFGEKLMALYKEHGVNPFGSCLPMLVQIPVLWLLYTIVRLYQFQFANGHFLWIGSGLAEKYPNIIGANLAQPDIPLLLLYSLSMFVSQRLTVVDPTQAEQQKIMSYAMSIMFAVMFWIWAFPSAFMLYWLFFNIFSTTQQYLVLRQPVGPEGPPTGGGGAPVEPTKRPVVKAGSKARRRGRRCDAVKRPHPAWNW